MAGHEYTCFSTLSSEIGVRRFSSSSSTLSLIPAARGSEKGLADLKTAELALIKAIQGYKEPSTSSGSFRELANGVFQAEGCVSA